MSQQRLIMNWQFTKASASTVKKDGVKRNSCSNIIIVWFSGSHQKPACNPLKWVKVIWKEELTNGGTKP